jgi:hypothetical protein
MCVRSFLATPILIHDNTHDLHLLFEDRRYTIQLIQDVLDLFQAFSLSCNINQFVHFELHQVLNLGYGTFL